jgi:hypothetical protein
MLVIMTYEFIHYITCEVTESIWLHLKANEHNLKTVSNAYQFDQCHHLRKYTHTNNP